MNGDEQWLNNQPHNIDPRSYVDLPDEKSRASWNPTLEKILAKLLHEHNTPEYRGQNRWTSEAWNKIVKEFNEKDRYAFTKAQIQEKEKELKREYRMLKEARKQSGASWNNQRCMIEAEPAMWNNIITDILQKEPIILPQLSHHNIQLLHKLRVIKMSSMSQRRVVAAPRNKEEKEPKKQKKSVGVEGLMERYLDMRTKQAEDEATQLAREKGAHLAKEKENNDFSIKKCISILNSMVEVTKEEKAKAYTVFKNVENREIFVSACEENVEYALIWLRNEMA
uniref:Myb/SANT-like domain-containing protein n=1 Tax=Oryza punctata TaxID=4537 RepID=A0A0E0LA70_ORYPU